MEMFGTISSYKVLLVVIVVKVGKRHCTLILYS